MAALFCYMQQNSGGGYGKSQPPETTSLLYLKNDTIVLMRYALRISIVLSLWGNV